MVISCTDVAVPRPGGAVSDQHAPEGLIDAARDAGLRNDLDLEPVLHTPRSLDSLVPGPVTAQGPAQIGMTLRKIFVAFMVLLSLALSACGGDNKNPIAPTPVPAPTPAPAPTPTTAPELVVDAPTVNDNSPATGAPFTLSATVRNAGDGESAATTLRFYQSTDETITTADAEVGTAAVGGLAASATSSESISLTAPATAGTYYYGACVDAVTDESDTANNCAAAVQVTVPEPTPTTAPDLVVDAPTVNDSSPATGAPFTLSATVRNAGDGESAATTLSYRRSTDGTITTSDTSVGTDAVGGLAAGAVSVESINLTAPSTAGTYYYGACVGAVADESDTTNNCAASVQVTVPAPTPQAPRTSFGGGTWLVNTDIAPGRYFTNPSSGCYWERLSGTGGTTAERLANEFIGFNSAQEIVDISSSDYAFTSSDCGTWSRSPVPAPAAGSIPPGRWLVGRQVPAGEYETNAQSGCYWERLSGFSGNSRDRIANDFVGDAGRQIVSLSSSDAGFYSSSDCGTWSRRGP